MFRITYSYDKQMLNRTLIKEKKKMSNRTFVLHTIGNLKELQLNLLKRQRNQPPMESNKKQLDVSENDLRHTEKMMQTWKIK